MSQFTSFADEFYRMQPSSKKEQNPLLSQPQQETPVPAPAADEFGPGDYAWDIAKAPVRGVLGAASDVADLGTALFGYDVPDYFGLMEPSKTTAGGVTEGITNFLTGFIPGVGIAGKLGKVGKIGQLTKAMDTAIDVAKVAGKTKKAAALKGTQAFIKGSVGGAIADFGTFDGHEARLSNLLREHAGLTDPFTAYLAADENDNEIEGRLKNAIEGLVIGGLTEGLFNAFRMYKAGYFAKSNGLDVNEALAAEAIKIRGEQRELVKTAFNLTDEQAEATNILIDRMGLDRKKIKIVSGEEARIVYETAAGTEAVLMQQGKKFAERVPELQEAAQQLKEGKITREDYAAIVDKYKPVRPLTEVPAVLGPDQARAALSSDKAPRYGVPSTTLKEGDEVGIRLDIPAYRDNGVWVVSIHESQSGFSAGKSIGYESTAVITDARFGTQEKAALSVAAGKARDSIATIKGKWKPMDAAQAKALADEAMSNPTEWRQVGVDLERHSYFYDRETMRPITAADEVVQIGNAVFAKNAKYDEASKFLYQGAEGGEVRGFAAFAEDGKSIIGGLSNPDVSTAIEEITHVARRQLFDKDIAADVRFGISDADIDTAARWSGATEVDGKWTWSVDAEERFAAGMNSYLRTGEAPAGLEGLFRKMSDWLIGLYREIKGSTVDVKVSKEMEKVFSNLLERGPGFDRAGTAVSVGAVVLRSTTPSPGSAGLGKPPVKELNLERFSSVDEINRSIDDFIEREPLASTLPEAQRPISEVARAAQTTADELRAISGMEGLDLQRMLNEGTTSRWQIERATRELMGLRKFAANAGNRLHELSKKGSSASKEEMYEFLVGERSLTIVLQTIKERSREVARSLGALRYVPTPEKSFTFLPSFKPGEAISPGAAVPPPGSAVPSPGTIPTEAPRMPVEPPDAVPTSAVPGTLPTAPEAIPAVPTAPSGLTPEAMDEIMTRLIDQAGGADAVRTSMNRYLAAAAGGGDEAVLRMARGQQKWMSALVEFWMNNILSGPITHAVNNSANLLTTLYLPFERMLGATIRGDMKTVGVTIKQYSFLLQQAHDAVKMAGVALKMDSNVLDTIATRETGNARAISAKGLGMAEDSIFGQAANWVGTALNLPTRFLTAEDEFFKQLNYRASFLSELYVDGLQKFKGDTTAASRYANETFNRAIQDGQMYAREVVLQRAYKAADEAIAAGTIAATERGEFVGKYMGKQKNWDSRLGVMSNRALDNARAATFSTPLTNDPNAMITTRLASRMQQVANEHPAIRFLLPFIRTPTNLLNFTLDRSIFKTAYADAPKAFRDFNRELNHADAAIRADAAGRLAFSFAVTSVVATAALSGKITGGGPKNKGERDTLMQAGWQPYSIKVGDKYFSYKREDPFASIIGLVADTAEGLKYADERHMDAMSSTIYTIVLALARNITNKTYLTGVTNVTNAISNPEQFGSTLVNQYVSGLVPFSAALDQSKSTIADDPVLRDARSMIDAIYSKIPFLAEEVTPQRNILGEVMEKPKALGPDIFSPVLYTQVTDDLILQEFGLLGHGFTPPKAMKGALDLTQFKTGRGQQTYDRWLELHGTVRVRGKTLRQALATTIKSRDYQKLSPATTQEYDSPRVRVLRGIISDYRAAAYDQLLKESPELMRADRLDFANKKALRMGRSAQELFDLINR
jgi:hypothetical protein